MDLISFSSRISLESKQEIDKCLYVAFFLTNYKNLLEFTMKDLIESFDLLHYSRPNQARLKKNMLSHRLFIKGSSEGLFKMHAKAITKLKEELAPLLEKPEEIKPNDNILPSSLYSGTRGYIESLSKQINASYEHNIFDGCAVLMRRLLEILLIQSYEHLKIESEIKESDGSYKMLNIIIENAKRNGTLSLSRNTKENLEDFRALGNFSAHKIFYTAKRGDIQKISIQFRASIEELLYKSGLIK